MSFGVSDSLEMLISTNPTVLLVVKFTKLTAMEFVLTCISTDPSACISAVCNTDASTLL
jgi:hypothetical protein